MIATVRKVREEDAAAIVALLNPIILAGTFTVMDRVLTVADQVAFIGGFPRRGVFHVAVTDDGQIVGLQDVMPLSEEAPGRRDIGEISTFVAMDAHRRGIGRRLSTATFDAAREQGFAKLSASVRADNPPAIAFYRSVGFSLVDAAQDLGRSAGRRMGTVLLEKVLA